MSDYFDQYANANGQAWAYNNTGYQESIDNGSSSSWQDVDRSNAHDQGQTQAPQTTNTSYFGQRASAPIALPDYGNSLGSGPSDATHVSSSFDFQPQDIAPFPQSEDGRSVYSSYHAITPQHQYNGVNGTSDVHIPSVHSNRYGPQHTFPTREAETSFSHEASYLGGRFDREQNNLPPQHGTFRYDQEDNLMEGSMTSNATATPMNLHEAQDFRGQQSPDPGEPNAGPPTQYQPFAWDFPTGDQHMQSYGQLTESDLRLHNAAHAEGQVPVSSEPDPCPESSATAAAREQLANGVPNNSSLAIEDDHNDHASDGAFSDELPTSNDKQKEKKAKAPKAPTCGCERIKSTSAKAIKQARDKAKKNAEEGKIAEDFRPKFQQPPLQYSKVTFTEQRTFIKQRSILSYVCSECGEVLGSDEAKERHVLLQHWTTFQLICFICSGFVEFDPPEPLPPLGAPVDYTEATGPPWKCRLCHDNDPGSFKHTWELLGHLQHEHYYAVSSANMHMIRRNNEAASTHFGDFADEGHVRMYEWLKKKKSKHLFTVVDAAPDILRFCDIHGGPIVGLAQLGKCRVQQEHDRSTMITSLRVGFTQAVLRYMCLPQIKAHFEWAVCCRWGKGFRHPLRWPWNGEDASRLLRALELLSFHLDECVSRQSPPGECDGCPHLHAIEPSRLAMLAVELATVDQRPAARPMPEEAMPVPKTKGPAKKGKQPQR